jgi:hypothetical protein
MKKNETKKSHATVPLMDARKTEDNAESIQCCASGSCRIRNYLQVRIRIRNQFRIQFRIRIRIRIQIKFCFQLTNTKL